MTNDLSRPDSAQYNVRFNNFKTVLNELLEEGDSAYFNAVSMETMWNMFSLVGEHTGTKISRDDIVWAIEQLYQRKQKGE